MEILTVDLGNIDYMEALSLQNELLILRQQGRIKDVLLLLEHPAVLTIGRSGSRRNMRLPEDVLKDMGVMVYDVNRGGDITYHGPGQIVGYPIIDLTCLGKDVRRFVHSLEAVFIDLLREKYGIDAGRDSINTGVWVGADKIAAIGLAVRRWVTQHGFAFNVNTDLSHFQWINPCGITGRGVTSLQALLGSALKISHVKDQVADAFCRMYSFKRAPMDKYELLAKIRSEI